MQKLYKIIIIFILIFSGYVGISNAETTNLYNDVENENTNNTSSNTSIEEEIDETENSVENHTALEDTLDFPDDTNTSNTASTRSTFKNSNARVNTVSSIPEANLGLNNVLCIILIAIGILLALLAIAILILLKK